MAMRAWTSIGPLHCFLEDQENAVAPSRTIRNWLTSWAKSEEANCQRMLNFILCLRGPGDLPCQFQFVSDSSTRAHARQQCRVKAIDALISFCIAFASLRS